MEDRKKQPEEEHVITEREKRAWQAGKNRVHQRVRPELTMPQRIEFLKMISKMASPSKFERELGLEPGDVEHYRKLFDIESPEEARGMARKLQRENEERHEAHIVEQTKQARAAEAVAQQRLDQMEAKRNQERPPVRQVDKDKVKREDAERQRRLTEQQEQQAIPSIEWRLEVEGTESQRQEIVDRFRREIMYRGLSFLNKKYGATHTQVKHEASRLGLKINWDIVRR